MQDIISPYRQLIDKYINELPIPTEPKNLYEPVRYALDSGGKRLRSVLCMIAADIFVDDSDKILPVAAMVEIFHNFSLVHDDIMDEAPLRRGKPSVYTKYDINTGILSGDVMLIYTYKIIHDNYDANVSYKILGAFTKMSTEVCEGQQMDMDFEKQNDVTIEDYLKMITYKTAVLMATTMQLGAIAAGADDKSQHHLYHYGLNMGIAFQIQDDILDVFGEPVIGKKKAGDIINNKKTYLYLKALELGDDNEKAKLVELYNQKNLAVGDEQEKINDVMQIFANTHVRTYANEMMESYRDLAFSHLEAIPVAQKYKSALKMLGNYILERKY